MAAGYSYYQDVEKGLQDGWIKWAVLGEKELETYHRLLESLGAGEASSLSVAFHRGWLLITDDLRARRKAKAKGVSVTGTAGCLIRAVKAGICALDEANAWLAAMIKAGYYAPVMRLDKFFQ